jgi:hypothetical protein
MLVATAAVVPQRCRATLAINCAFAGANNYVLCGWAMTLTANVLPKT